MAQFSFDDVVRYVKGLVGHHAEVSAHGRGHASLFVAGTVSAVDSHPSGAYFCQVGERRDTGFLLLPDAFDGGSLDLADPESLMLRIRHKGTDVEIWIREDRLSDYEQLPGLDQAE
jgi:hypothetical protein